MAIKQVYITNQNDIQNPLVDETAYKLSIQAPVGNKFEINGIEITIGYSGIYELHYPGIIIDEVRYISGSTPIYIDYSTDNFVSDISSTQPVTSQTNEDDEIPMSAIDADGQEGGGQ